MKTMSLIGGIDTYAFNKRFRTEESPAGRSVFFLGANGRTNELELAKSIIKEHQVLTVKEIYVGRSTSTVEFEEFPGKEFNTVMFADLDDLEEDEDPNLPF
ncbi:hypothetical protein [Planomicrobium sp. MB-3u-38]|uniref:hypothetical protein n=1 Tax=Planomicrobium sp. MB-3u-38 TaxID=2058318 RepID=UPI0018EBF471|nr:hypothetical protein [Planomicrobium sp. MB-3u-38]